MKKYGRFTEKFGMIRDKKWVFSGNNVTYPGGAGQVGADSAGSEGGREENGLGVGRGGVCVAGLTLQE